MEPLNPASRFLFTTRSVNPELVDSTVQYISKYHTTANFSFINQNGDHYTKDYEGKIYVADFSLQPAAPFVQNDSQSFDVQGSY
jgi:hypothetical protein